MAPLDYLRHHRPVLRAMLEEMKAGATVVVGTVIWLTSPRGRPRKRSSRTRPGKLSGGQQQRVAIARALANDPPVILGDEVTGNLEGKTGRRIVGLLQRLAHEGRTVALVTHDQRIAREADRRIELEDGRLVAGETAPERREL